MEEEEEEDLGDWIQEVHVAERIVQVINSTMILMFVPL